MTDLYPWQQAIWQRLVEQHQQQRLPHAILLSGPAGLAKNDLAQQLAKLVLCENSTEQPCGHCQNCQLMATGNHPDHVEVRPEELGKLIKVDQIRELKQKQSLTAHIAQWKTVIISPADAMNHNASNSLLKLLEEPQQNSLLILITSNISSLPITIKSRCQQFTISPPDTDSAITWLQQYSDIDQQQLKLALQLAKGAPIAARDLIDQDQLTTLSSVSKEFSQVLKGQSNPVELAQLWQQYDLNLLFHFLQYRIKTQLSTSESKVRPSAHYWAIYDCIIEAMKLLSSSTNVNKVLLIEQFLVSVSQLTNRTKPVAR